jgi:hypothetical protein
MGNANLWFLLDLTVEWITGNFDVFALARRQLVEAEARWQGTS